ncbi:conserved hypothetical protein [Cenarchaeum symbiosum A]|uniref:LTD domain-containing protein n=1 Tax=Cenarchaeum symbiosum (strain A) TaxID=414004 RepID=A0RWX8_CENSY|nr:conserved hypothetical protein [Cenarchaeum symbiosum A]
MKALYAVLALGLVAAMGGAHAQSGPVHVVINEVDTNPPGNDALQVVEWVELYNPSAFPADISGWTISQGKVGGTLTIPHGTVLGPYDHDVFHHKKNWFADSGAQVILRDASDLLVDRTHRLYDRDNDRSSWQRTYDGLDTGSSGDWSFAKASVGNSNGERPEVKQEGTIRVTLDTGKSQYVFGEKVRVHGAVSESVFVEKPTFGVATVNLVVLGPGYRGAFSLYPDFNLEFEEVISLQKAVGLRTGEYLATVEYAGARADASFSVVEPEDAEEIEAEGALSISFDEEFYIPGQTATITARTSEITQYAGLKFQVEDPEGVNVLRGTLYPDAAGRFATTMFMDTVGPTFGRHVITAAYGGEAASSYFELTEEAIEDRPISLYLDGGVYAPGDTVEITGRLNNRYVFSLDVEIQQVGTTSLDTDSSRLAKESGAVRLEGDSTFKYEYEIGNNPDRLGEYRVRISKNVGSAEAFFQVVEDPVASFTDAAAPLTVYTDEVTYEQGSRISIYGKVNRMIPLSSYQTDLVEISMSGSEGKLGYDRRVSSIERENVEYTLTAVPDIAGNYRIEDTLYSAIYPPGEYSIRASHAGGEHTANARFAVTDPLDFEGQYKFEINSEVLGLGEEVIVRGIYPGAVKGSGIDIILYRPDGDTDRFGTLVDDSKFSWSWRTPIAEKEHRITNDRIPQSSNYGVYRVAFSADSWSENIFFKVSPNPEADTLGVAPLEVSTDKPVYLAGEEMVISGVAQKNELGAASFERAESIVKQAVWPYKVVYSLFLELDGGGNFGTVLDLPATIFDGTYRVDTSYGGHSVRIPFEVVNELQYGDGLPLELILSSDRSEYRPGETVNITGRPNKLVYLSQVDITVVSESQDRVTCGIQICGTTGTTEPVVPTASGTFSYSYRIPPGAEALGGYEILADTDFGTYHLAFNVTEAPPVQEPVGFEHRETEKFRSTDNMTRISAVPVISGGIELMPRTIQGTLITPDRGEESAVNLRVSAAGICVIGDGCAVSGPTRDRGTVYAIVEVDGRDYQVRYSGADVQFEKFTVLPAEPGDFIHVEDWDVEIEKEDQVSLFYHRITRVSP